MPVKSGRDKWIEVWMEQFTGSVPEADGFYLRVLQDLSGKHCRDIRYYWKDPKGNLRPTSKGCMLDEGQWAAFKELISQADVAFPPSLGAGD